jgi:hypothetical protein
LNAKRTRGLPHVAGFILGLGISGVDHEADRGCGGKHFMQEAEPLRPKPRAEQAYAGEVATRLSATSASLKIIAGRSVLI